MKYTVILTFDLEGAEPEDYEKAKNILADHGLFPVSPKKELSLPQTTVLGVLNKDIEASQLRNYFWKLFKNEKLNPKRMLGGTLSDWAMKIKQK
jgi:hypothetical protein